jgi:hypothetical protein
MAPFLSVSSLPPSGGVKGDEIGTIASSASKCLVVDIPCNKSADIYVNSHPRNLIFPANSAWQVLIDPVIQGKQN